LVKSPIKKEMEIFPELVYQNLGYQRKTFPEVKGKWFPIRFLEVSFKKPENNGY